MLYMYYVSMLFIYIYIYMGDIFHIHMRTLDSPSVHPKGFPGVHIIHIHTYLYILILIHYIYTHMNTQNGCWCEICVIFNHIFRG